MKNKLLLIHFLFFIPFCLFALPKDLQFRHYNLEDGLSSNCVRALLQDKFGFIWAGTDGGLIRYDGTEFKSYKYSNKLPRGLNQNFILSLYEANDALWIGTDEGLFCYDYSNDSFSPFLINGKIAIDKPVICVAQDQDSTIWIATDGYGLYKYNIENDSIQHYEITSCLGFVYTVIVDNENQVWIVSKQGNTHVFKLNRITDRFEPFKLIYNTPEESNSRSLTIYEDSDLNLWLGTWENGLQKINRYTGQVTSYLSPSEGYKNTHIHSIMEYMPNILMIGSDDGLTVFNTVSGHSCLYSSDETQLNSISNKFVYPIIKDNEGGVWLGTYYGGLNYISPTCGQFESFSFSKYTNSVGGNIIGNFCEDNQGNIWIASDDGGLNCYNPGTGLFKQYTTEGGKGLSYHNVHALCIDDDDLWIGTYTGGVNVLNLRTNKFRHYMSDFDDINTLDGSSSYSIFKDREDRIWVATMSGVNLFNREDDSFIRIRDLGALPIDIDQDIKGNIWFSTQGKGLFKYNPKSQTWKNYTMKNTSNTLPSNQVNCICIDKAGLMWIGTSDGLCRYVAEEDKFVSYSIDMLNNNICSIIEDQHILWLTTSNGLIRFVPGQDCQFFTKSDGLISDRFLVNSACKSSDGRIYVGTVNGFNAFYPYQIKTNTIAPAIYLTGFELFNKEIFVGHNLLSKSLNEMERIELPYRDNVFSLRFAALSYCTPTKNQYAYMLEGFDKEWNFVGTQNKATYTNLPAGKYTFKVKASNNDGLWNEDGKSIDIIIHPPFYFSNLFLILYVILFCLALFLVIRFTQTRSKRLHYIEIKNLNEAKEREMHEAKINFFTMIAHEIRTPVSLIIGPLEKIMQNNFPIPESIRSDLNIIDRNSQRLLCLINQLLDFRKVEQNDFNLNYKKQNICCLLRTIIERFEHSIKQDGGLLIVKYPKDDFEAVVDSETIIKVVSNLLSNARKYMKSEVVVECEAHFNSETFSISVYDDGKGISHEDQQKIFKPFYQVADNKPGTGIGLSIVKNLVEANNGKIDLVSDINKGSLFIITLPINLQYTVDIENNHTISSEETIDYVNNNTENIIDTDKEIILIVDDNKDMLSFLSDNFIKDYIVITAMNGKEALEKLNNHVVSFIISDWMMPGMSGVDFCKAIRGNQMTSHIPFLLLTAKTDVNSKIEGMDCGADIYLEKPFSINHLNACIRNLMDIRTMLHQKFSNMPLVTIDTIAGNSADEKFLAKINEIIEENFSNPDLSVDFLAEKLCISRSGLFAKIKTLANITPNELIQLVRLKKSANLLLKNQYRINEICYMVGFNNPSYFTKCFHKQFGMNPGEFIANKEDKKFITSEA